MADDLLKAGEDKLQSSIAKAQSVLSEAFGGNLSGKESYRFLELSNLAEAYSSESQDLNVVSESFIGLAKEIKGMRSSYLPVEFFKNLAGTFESYIADSVSEKESYENAFMRMLGMPSSSDTRLSTANEIVRVSSSGELLKSSFEEVQREVLDQRNKERGLRSLLINNSIYNINNLPSSFSGIVKDGEDSLNLNAVISGAMQSSEEIDSINSEEARVTNIEDDLFKFSYLLLPAIQDDRVSGCINETDKIIAKPFSPSGGRIINESTIRPTLIESIIRIRLDRLSGSDDIQLKPNDEETGTSFGSKEEEVIVNSNSYGMLESLFILRLTAALSGLAKTMNKNIEDFIETSEGLRLIPNNESYTDKSPGGTKEADFTADNSSPSTPSNDGTDVDNGKKELEDQLLIEDAIMSLLGDNGEILNLQTQTHRNSSIHNAHLMSGLLGVVDIPRKRIRKELEVKKEVRNSKMDVSGGEASAPINTMLGVANGVGTVDIAVFCLALFTISEEGLIGLLPQRDYENLLTSDYKDLPTDLVIRNDIVKSVNEFSSLVIAGYKLFQKELGNQDQASF